MKLFALEEFASRRRKVQDQAAAALQPLVVAAIGSSEWTADLTDMIGRIFNDLYTEESGETLTEPHPRQVAIMGDLVASFERATVESDPRTVALAIANAVIGAATYAAAEDDPEDLFMEWVSMADGAVREEHADTHGQVRPIGVPFDVAGVEMPYPGWVGAPVELWINCRCTPRPVLAGDFTAQHVTPAALALFREVSSEERERDASAGRAMEDGSYPIDNCADLRNAIQAIGRAKDPAKTKAHIRRRKSSLGCPEVSLPQTWSLTAAAEANTSTIVAVLPAEDDPVNDLGDEQKHVTVVFVGETDDSTADVLRQITEEAARTMKPFTASVSGPAVLGKDEAKVLLVEAHDLNRLRGLYTEDEMVQSALAAADSHPHFVPHITLTYGETPEGESPSEIRFDRLAVWHRDDRTEYPLGGTMPDTPALVASAYGNSIPWHGPLAPEEKWSGDKRKFAKDSLTHRPLPLPYTWQKVSDEGHKGNVVVAMIEHVRKIDGVMHGAGHILETVPEADEFVGLLAEFGRFGTSVDADESEFEMDENEQGVVFSHARISSACAVPIPAFAEAWIQLGKAPWLEDEEGAEDKGQVPEGADVPDEEMLKPDAPDPEDPKKRRAPAVLDGTMQRLKISDRPPDTPLEMADVAPGRTEDGPGWLTHPVDTDRIRDYWVSGPGAAKINWGTPGDFNRCRALVAEHVKPQHINGYCANRHYDALKKWPGPGKNRGHAADAEQFSDAHQAPAVSLVAAGGWCAPSDWFKDPEFAIGDGRLVELPDGGFACPLTVTKDGRVFGHIASWSSCHTGSQFQGICQAPPRSETDYAYFHTGAVALDDDTMVATGRITVGGGHAPGLATMAEAMAHYDSTSAAVADVVAGEDEFGIWCAGWVRPGATDAQIAALRASPPSGDWRPIGRFERELIAAHCVNTPGFVTPRPRMATSEGRQVSLVAAGAVPHVEPVDTAFAQVVSAAVAAEILAVQERRAELERMAMEMESI